MKLHAILFKTLRGIGVRGCNKHFNDSKIEILDFIEFEGERADIEVAKEFDKYFGIGFYSSNDNSSEVIYPLVFKNSIEKRFEDYFKRTKT